MTEHPHTNIGQHPDQLACHPSSAKNAWLESPVWFSIGGTAIRSIGERAAVPRIAFTPSQRRTSTTIPATVSAVVRAMEHCGAAAGTSGRSAAGVVQRLHELRGGIEPVGRVLRQRFDKGPGHLGRHRGPQIGDRCRHRDHVLRVTASAVGPVNGGWPASIS